MQPFFSIIVVCLNPGKKLASTLESIEKQTFTNYEVIVKDGLSVDGSVRYARELCARWEHARAREQKQTPTLLLLSEKDKGIYDAMNQAALRACGRYVYYLNSGDYFHSETVLQELADAIEKLSAKQEKAVYYGNIFERRTGQEIASNPHMDAFGCYRNVPCHQACFYSRELLLAHPFVLKYKVRADYEQFLWCFFKGEAGLYYIPQIIADYEGGGYSETAANRSRSAAEHAEVTKIYFSGLQLLKYKLILLVTLAPLRTCIAENPKTAGIYNRFKDFWYGKGKK